MPDAKAFGAEMEKAGAGQYAQVRVTLALDADATAGKLEETVRKLAGEISPRDTFVLYAAAHGYSVGGNYYMIPQDYQGGAEPGGAQGPRHRPGAPAGLDRQPHQGEEGADPARHLRIRRADRRLYEVAHRRAGLGGGGWAAA